MEHLRHAPHTPTGRLYYGWILVVTLAVTETTSWGILYYSFTVFLAPMQAELGWSRAAMTGAFSVAMLASGLAGVPAGRWLDRHGPRLLMTVGSCVATGLVLVWASVPNLAVFYLVWAAIGVTMSAVLYEPAFVVVANWFERRRGRALTVLTFIAGLASVIYIPLTGWLVEVQGWRTALVTLAVILAVGTIPLHAFVLRGHPPALPEQERRAPAGSATSAVPVSIPMRVAVQGSTFRWLAAAFTLNALGGIALTVHLVPFLTDRGEPATFAAGVAGFVGIMAMPGRLVFTPLGDRVPRAYLTAFIFVLQAIAIGVLLLVPGRLGIVAYIILFGLGFGAITLARAALVAEFYGPAQYGSISGVLSLITVVARALAPFGAGVAFDLMGSYRPIFTLLAVLAVGAAFCVLQAERMAARLGMVARRS